MRMALSAKNKMGFVNGTIPKPKSPASSVALWDRCNDMVLSWLLNSISSDIAHSVIYAETAQAVWNDLEERFSQSNAPRIYQIKRSISTLLQEQSSLAAYFTKLKGYWDELASYTTAPTCTCGALKTLSEYQQQERLYQFLMGLNDSYSAIRSQILAMDSLPTVSKAYSLILQEEKQRELHVTNPTMPNSAILSVTKHETHGATPQDSGQYKTRSRPRCDHCKRLGHVKSKCYKLHGYPAKSANAASTPFDANVSGKDTTSSTSLPQLTAAQYEQLLSILNLGTPQHTANLTGKSVCCTSISPSAWVIDTGASDHITYSMHSLSNVTSCHDTKPQSSAMASIYSSPPIHIFRKPISLHLSPSILCFPSSLTPLLQPRFHALKTGSNGGSQDAYDPDLLRKPVISPVDHGDKKEELTGISDDDDVEGSNGEGRRSYKQREEEDWVDWEDQILEDTVPLVGFVRMILHSGKYGSHEKLSPEHEKRILERLLPYHPEYEKKIGCGIDHITIGYHPDFENSRCLFIVRKDGELVDFSYWKCIKGLIKQNYPLYADSFILRHFRRRRRSE
ncbi:hypothetical protein HHK36_009914 [Tetracentron sinense]|uniref:Uncharacterized protein n=1 Tax=Tetracentron sinense TaxID=13715 RepID=A0A835DHY7_TETSI|nr:hypothetical protein HHK36_009914 [Tetracentron sinense]